MTGYSATCGPITVEGEEAMRKEADAGICPRCKRPLRDLRETAFSTRAIEREGVCFRWGVDAFTCLGKERA